MSIPIIKQAELPFSREDEVQMLRDDNRFLKEENAALKEQLARVLHQQFGSKSEYLEDATIGIEVEETVPPAKTEEPAALPTPAPPTRKRRLRVRYRKVVEEVIIPQEALQHPEDYTLLPKECAQISQRVEYRPAYMVLHRYIRLACVKKGKRSKAKQDAPIYAAAPATILPGSNIDASVVAHVIHGKFNQHLPLYRQLNELERLVYILVNSLQ